MKYLATFILYLLFQRGVTALPDNAITSGTWQVTALTPSYLLLSGTYQPVLLEAYRQRYQERAAFWQHVLPKWALEYQFDITGTEVILALRPTVVSSLRDGQPTVTCNDQPMEAIRAGYWMNPLGQGWYPDATGVPRLAPSRNAEVAHYLFIRLANPLSHGDKVKLTLATGQELHWQYDSAAPSPLFKFNQLGYMPTATRKYAYIGAWMGTGGPFPAFLWDTHPFQLMDSATHQCVYSGIIEPRPEDPKNGEGEPWTGEEVCRMDFSSVVTPGRYYLQVPGIGRSHDFLIADQTMAEAFYIHARGLFHRRCGQVRSAPYTHWRSASCHHRVYQGRFPAHDHHYPSGANTRDYGFFDGDGNSIQVNQFTLIANNIPEPPRSMHLPGGWHDAADYDRRPYHLAIVSDIAALYLLRPRNFSDGQLNIPESGDGIPDLLNEACWGLAHLLRAQQPNGGVGTWIETTRHPDFYDNGAPKEKLDYYLAAPTRNSTLDYCAAAAELALALQAAGATNPAIIFRQSAALAWEFALNPTRRFTAEYNYPISGTIQKIRYSEPAQLEAEILVRAGSALYILTGEEKYLNAVVADLPRAQESLRANGWKWSPFYWNTLEHFSSRLTPLEPLRVARRRQILENADKMLLQCEDAWPYPLPWHQADSGLAHNMSWGTVHPLRRATMLVAAHAYTGEAKYLTAAQLANDFHNGANPMGCTLTSGLGRVYPLRFLDLDSFADGIAEPIPGITPFRWTYGIDWNDVRMAHGIYAPARNDQYFPGAAISLLPRGGLSDSECAQQLRKVWPIWRRWSNLESLTPAASEYTVWETISPAVITTGYLLNGAQAPTEEWRNRKPATNLLSHPGYLPLP